VLRQAFDRVPDESREALRRAADEASSVEPSVVYRRPNTEGSGKYAVAVVPSAPAE